MSKSKSGIVNVRMVITEEKILSNIDKIQKMINPNNKKTIVQLEEDTYFKDLIESIKSYIVEYPKKKNFPVSVYKSAYELVEFATIQFEENTNKIEELIKQREENIALAGDLKQIVDSIENKEEGWKENIEKANEQFGEDIVEAIYTIVKCKSKESQTYLDSKKILNARINNLESNLHIEIDMERLEDSSKALSFIGIEIADALKLIPTPEEQIEAIMEQEEKIEQKDIEEQIEEYKEEITFEVKPSLWSRVKNSKIVRAATYVFRIKIKIELPSNALPEGRGEN